MNQLKVNYQQSIVTLHQQGWSKRKIARELGVDRVTVRKYLAAAAKSPTPHTGSESALDPKSLCQPHRSQIEQAMQQGLSIQRIYQDLIVEHQFAGSYHAVRRFVRKLGMVLELPFRRMECEPGEEMQVDFGQGAWVIENGNRKRPW